MSPAGSRLVSFQIFLQELGLLGSNSSASKIAKEASRLLREPFDLVIRQKLFLVPTVSCIRRFALGCGPYAFGLHEEPKRNLRLQAVWNSGFKFLKCCDVRRGHVYSESLTVFAISSILLLISSAKASILVLAELAIVATSTPVEVRVHRFSDTVLTGHAREAVAILDRAGPESAGPDQA